jgi:hypothetical protein
LRGGAMAATPSPRDGPTLTQHLIKISHKLTYPRHIISTITPKLTRRLLMTHLLYTMAHIPLTHRCLWILIMDNLRELHLFSRPFCPIPSSPGCLPITR